MPAANIYMIREVPPKLINGKVMPVVGNRFKVTEIFIKACRANQKIKPQASSLE